MKKSLIALAVLAASGAAMAQSSVTVYGIVDVAVASVKKNGVSNTLVESGGLKSNRWGLKGTEDLGGGLKASFKLEQRFKSDTGALDGVNFKGASSVSLEGGFGKLTLGRDANVYDDLRVATNPVADTNMSPVADTIKLVGSDYSDKYDNSISYRSPSFGGFSVGVSYSLGENKDATSATSDNAILLQYKDGPLLVGYAYSNLETKATNGPISDKATFNLLSASYDFGVAKLVGGYQNEDVKDAKSYYLGVQAPVTSSVNVFAAYTNSKNDSANTKATGYTLAANYVLSKRTDLYAGYKNVKQSNSVNKTSTFAVGVRHYF